MKWLAGIIVERVIRIIIDFLTDLFVQWENKKKIIKKIEEISNEPDPRRRAADIDNILS